MNFAHMVTLCTILALIGCSNNNSEEQVAASPDNNGNMVGTEDNPVGPEEANGTLASENNQEFSEAGKGASQISSVDPSGSNRLMTLLPTEQTFLRNGSVSVDAVGRVIQTREFGKVVQQLALESATDPLAQDMSKLQSQQLKRNLEGVGHISAFACGLTICAGSIDIGNNLESYQQFVDASNKNPSGSYSYMDYLAETGNGNFEARFIMSIDPNANGVTGRGR